MKFFGLILILAVASSQGSGDVSRSERSAIDTGLAAVVEQVRDMMVNGNEDMGIPVLEPLEVDSLAFDIDNDSATLAGTLTDLKVNGLSKFTADTLSFSIIGVRFAYCFNWDTITVSSKYTVDGSVIQVIPIYGDGEFEATVSNLNVCGTLALSVSGGYLYVRTSTVALTLGDFDLKITGLLDSEDVSALVSAVASDVVPQLIQDFQVPINSAVNDIITSLGNEILGTMTLAELLALIRG